MSNDSQRLVEGASRSKSPAATAVGAVPTSTFVAGANLAPAASTVPPSVNAPTRTNAGTSTCANPTAPRVRVQARQTLAQPMIGVFAVAVREVGVRIGARFNGPPTSAHGGTACGVFAAAVDAKAASVRLLAAPPLEQDFAVRRAADGRCTIAGDDGDVATVAPWQAPKSEVPLPRLTPSELRQAREHWMDTVAPRHQFPTCFGCGHLRPESDGLEMFAGRVGDRDLWACEWLPADGRRGDAVDDWLVWAAVDCPSGFATFPSVGDGEVILLGELSVEIVESPAVGGRYQVVARTGTASGRKLTSEVAVVGEDGTNLVRGRAIWIRLERAP